MSDNPGESKPLIEKNGDEDVEVDVDVPPVDGSKDKDERVEVKTKKEVKVPYTEHTMSLSELETAYSTHLDYDHPEKSSGLDPSVAEAILQRDGPNSLTPPPRTPLWLLFLMQFANMFMILLLLASAMCLLTYIVYPDDMSNLWLAIFLFVVVFVTCYETFAQEAKSDELMEKFRALVPEDTNVIRNGVSRPIPVAQLVRGDVIRLRSGDKVPADCRLIQNSSLKVDQSMLTGESEAVECQVLPKPGELAHEARNIVFNGSLVVDGSGLAVVIRTGDNTFIGTMVELTGDINKDSTNLKKDIDEFVMMIGIFSLVQATIVFLIAVLRGLPLLDSFIQGFIVIIVANIPQGLPSTVTACLYIIAERMATVNVFVKKLDVIETLGACSLICTDKTGTLTLNCMHVANLWLYSKKMTSTEFEEINRSELYNQILVSQARYLIDAATLNSRVVMERKKEGEPLEPSGDATEIGINRFFDSIIKTRAGMELETYRGANTKIHEVPFNSKNKWQMSIHKLTHQQGSECMFVKGGPDVILTKCSHYVDMAGNFVEIDELFTAAYNEAYEHFGGNGERVLAFAMKPLEKRLAEYEKEDPDYLKTLKDRLGARVGKDENASKDLIFIGLISLMDPPRPEVPGAIADCHSAGIQVVMVTGDHPLTAAAIAKKIGLLTKPTRKEIAQHRGLHPDLVHEDDVDAVVVHGADIDMMGEEDWDVLLSKPEIVFARTSPEQKLVIVQKFQGIGHLTAMTGDGVNDAPALKNVCLSS